MSEVQDQVKKIVIDHLGIDETKVTPEAKFIDDLGADSLDTVELVMAFEEKFGIEIPDDAAETIQTVQNAIDYIEAQKNKMLENIPMKKFGEPNDVANIVYFLSSNEASYITGQNFHVNGGMLMV